MNLKNKIDIIIKKLEELYPDARCSLIYEDPLQLMIATQLAAQCTDARVNIVTKGLFQKYKTVDDFASADVEELQHINNRQGNASFKLEYLFIGLRIDIIVDSCSRKIEQEHGKEKN